MSEQLSFGCWKCGEMIVDVPLPLSRSETCPHCRADLHACRQCIYYDTSKASACREPVAEHVTDKTRANFCGYLSINTEISVVSRDDSQHTEALNDLFGLDTEKYGTSPASSDQAQSALDELFGLNDDNKNQ